MTAAARLNRLWASTLAHSLAAGGVEHVVVSPGSRSTPLVLALAELGTVHTHVILDERAAGFVALGLARASGKPAALLCTSGTAAAHYLPAVLEARYGRVPLVVLSADRPPELHGCGAPQSIDQSHLFGGHVRLFVDLGAPAAEVSPRWLCQVVARSLDAARREPAGPVHLNVPFREPLWEPDLSPPPAPPAPARVVRPAPSVGPELVAELTARLRRVERGLLVCGTPPAASMQATAAFAHAVAELADRLGWPLLAEPTSHVRFGPHASGPVIAAYDALARCPPFTERFTPDLVVRFGQAPLSKPLSEWLGRASADRTLLVDPGGEWHDPSYAADTLVAVDPTALCRALARDLERRPSRAWLASWRTAETQAQQVLEQACAEGFWEGGIARTVAAHLPDGARLHVASSMPIRDFDSFAPGLVRDLHATANRGTNGIDGTLATAVGMAIAEPARPVVALLGDLAFLHDIGALRVAAELETKLTVVLVDNGGGGIFSFLPIAAHPEVFARYFSTPQAADLEGLARASGAAWQRVESYGDLAATLGERPPAVRVLAARVEREDNVARHQRTFAAVCEALTPTLFEQGA